MTAGFSAVNQAPVTGESIPIDKVAGDPVFAGTINETGILGSRVTAAADNTTLARIIHAVEQAQGTRAPTQRFVDRFLPKPTRRPSLPIAVAVAYLTPWLMGWAWMQSIYKGACPAGHCLSLCLGHCYAGNGCHGGLAAAADAAFGQGGVLS